MFQSHCDRQQSDLCLCCKESLISLVCSSDMMCFVPDQLQTDAVDVFISRSRFRFVPNPP